MWRPSPTQPEIGPTSTRCRPILDNMLEVGLNLIELGQHLVDSVLDWPLSMESWSKARTSGPFRPPNLAEIRRVGPIKLRRSVYRVQANSGPCRSRSPGGRPMRGDAGCKLANFDQGRPEFGRLAPGFDQNSETTQGRCVQAFARIRVRPASTTRSASRKLGGHQIDAHLSHER